MLATMILMKIIAKQHTTLKPRDYSDTAVCFQSILTKYYAKYFHNAPRLIISLIITNS